MCDVVFFHVLVPCPEQGTVGNCQSKGRVKAVLTFHLIGYIPFCNIAESLSNLSEIKTVLLLTANNSQSCCP